MSSGSIPPDQGTPNQGRPGQGVPGQGGPSRGGPGQGGPDPGASGPGEIYNAVGAEGPPTAEGWYNKATSQGTPPDYQPPSVPGVPPPGQGRPTNQSGSGGPGTPAGPGVNVINTSSDRAQGLQKCPKCGSTDVSMRASTGLLICHFCRNEWAEASLEETFGLNSPIDELSGLHMGSGASNILESAEDVLTLKCGACGADVVVNTAEALQARCHWCRNTLSINQQIPNGAVPDGLLPFSITKEDAIDRINAFVKARRFFAHPKFVREFSPHEVVGVYMPYLTLDANTAIDLAGVGEIETRRYTVKVNDRTETRYDADVYRVERSFGLLVDDVLLESSSQRADQDTSRNTNNIINAIQPFDVKQALTYNANYLRGFTSERRDLEVQGLMRSAGEYALSIGRSRANELTKQYNRGVRWEREQLTVYGTRWVALYVPVWLYSYYQQDKNLVHYVAVNGRTGATMGSVPVRQGLLVGTSTLIGLIGTAIGAGLFLLTLL